MTAVRMLAAIAALVTFAGVAAAQTAPPTRLRGSIEAISGNVVTMKTREGGSEKVTLADNWTVLLVAPIAMSDIKQGSYVGVASMKDTALEVLVFPEAMRGAGEGHYPWDLQPESMMTNATVSAVVAASDAQTLTLTHKGGTQTIAVRPGTPIVTFLPGTRDDAKVGAKVFVTATKSADGSLTAARMAIGKDGLTPPM